MSELEAAFQVDAWNAHNRIGVAVRVLLDDGSVRLGATTSEAWVVCGEFPVVKVSGVSGGVSLRRVAVDWE